MVKLLLAGAFLFGQNARHVDAEPIDPQPRAGTSAAVVVADSVPLVHTQQITADRVEPAVRRLGELLRAADSSLDRLVKLNFIVADDANLESLKQELARGTFGKGQPAVSFVNGKLPAGMTWAVDAVAMGTRRPAWKQVERGDGYAILPPGARVFISGQAVADKDLAVATRKTLAELHDTLKFLGLKESAVVQARAFMQPIAQHQVVQDELARFFQAAGVPPPPLALVEWQSSLPIEVELVVWAGRERAGELIEYLTPPGLKASPVYSRVARVSDGKLIYLSSLHGAPESDPGAEIPDIFAQMSKVLAKAGSDFNHLARATYYVTSAEVTRKMGELRPRYYDPKRPPAASLAQVAGVGRPRRTVTMDMIAVPSPRLKVNEYGPAELGHGLTASLLREGYIGLYDGRTPFGWSDAEVKAPTLLAGRSTLSIQRGHLRIDSIQAGKLHWGINTSPISAGLSEISLEADGNKSSPIVLADGLQLRSILYKPMGTLDITPREIGVDWKAIHHPKLGKERRADWSIKNGVLTAVGGPGCLEYQGKPFANFVLQLEARTRLRHANGGVFFRAIPGAFMNGYEAQVYNRCHDGDVARPWTWATGAIDDRQNTRRLVSRDGEWFHYTIVAVGDRLATFVNGHQTVDWQDTRADNDNPRLGRRTHAGALQLQAHDAGTEIEFRNLRIAGWN